MSDATYAHSAGSVSVEFQQTPDSVFKSFKKHCSAERLQTNLVVLEAIRESHPDRQVTVVSSRSCDLVGFAAAGHAQANFTTGAESFNIVRTYHAPPSRLSADEGNLEDHVSFGFYEYTWNRRSFGIFLVEWHDALIGQQKYFYILSGRTATDSLGRAPSVESLLLTCGKWTTVLHDEIYVFDSGFWTKSRELYSAVHSAKWEDVILDPTMKQNLIHDVCTFFDSRNTYQEYSVPWKRGVILHGIPGCGKTMSIKALMNDMSARDIASLYVKSFDGCQGRKRCIRDIFQHARTMAPCLLIFEDLDSLVQDELRSYFLNEIDGLENNHGILMIGSTNHIERLDPSISKRPSRFDRKYHFKLPNEHERFLYCQHWQRKFSGTGKIDFDDEMCRTVVDLTGGYTFAYMNELFVQSLLALVTGCVDLDKKLSCEESGVRDITSANMTTTSNGYDLGHYDTDSSGENNGNPAYQSQTTKTGRLPEHSDSGVFLDIMRKQAEALMLDIDASKASEPRVRPRNGRYGAEMDPKMFEMLEQAKAAKHAALVRV